jgi:hypothetical protein
MIWHDGIIINRDANSITYRGTIKFLRRKPGNFSFLFCQHIILAGPISVCDLFDLLYGEDDTGGPLFGRNLMFVMMYKIRPKLLNIDLQIKQSGPNGFKRFSISSLDSLPTSTRPSPQLSASTN